MSYRNFPHSRFIITRDGCGRKIFQAEVASKVRLGHWVPTDRIVLEESDFNPTGGVTIRNEHRREPYLWLSSLLMKGRLRWKRLI